MKYAENDNFDINSFVTIVPKLALLEIHAGDSSVMFYIFLC